MALEALPEPGPPRPGAFGGRGPFEPKGGGGLGPPPAFGGGGGGAPALEGGGGGAPAFGGGGGGAPGGGGPTLVEADFREGGGGGGGADLAGTGASGVRSSLPGGGFKGGNPPGPALPGGKGSSELALPGVSEDSDEALAASAAAPSDEFPSKEICRASDSM